MPLLARLGRRGSLALRLQLQQVVDDWCRRCLRVWRRRLNLLLRLLLLLGGGRDPDWYVRVSGALLVAATAADLGLHEGARVIVMDRREVRLVRRGRLAVINER